MGNLCSCFSLLRLCSCFSLVEAIDSSLSCLGCIRWVSGRQSASVIDVHASWSESPYRGSSRILTFSKADALSRMWVCVGAYRTLPYL